MGNVKYTGILKLSLDDAALSVVRTLWTKLPSAARPLAVENLHVTLVHQNILKPHKRLMATMHLPMGPIVELDPTVRCVVRPDRTSWISLVLNQDAMRDYVRTISDMLEKQVGHRIDEDRVFHVSLANLDGSPFSSVGDVSWDDVGGLDIEGSKHE